MCSTCFCQLLPTQPGNRYSMIHAVGLTANLAIIYVILRAPKMKTVTNVFALNLAVADGLFVLLLPDNITEYPIHSTGSLGSHSASWC